MICAGDSNECINANLLMSDDPPWRYRMLEQSDPQQTTSFCLSGEYEPEYVCQLMYGIKDAIWVPVQVRTSPSNIFLHHRMGTDVPAGDGSTTSSMCLYFSSEKRVPGATIRKQTNCTDRFLRQFDRNIAELRGLGNKRVGLYI